MTLEEFQELRARQQELLDEMQKLVSRDDFDLNFDRDTVTNTFVNRYFNIQKELEEYDLSDIPFDAWHGMTILGDKNHIADFSKTHANLDFSQIEISPLSNEDDFEGRFQGCTIRNLKEFGYNTLPDFFEQRILKGEFNNQKFDLIKDNNKLNYLVYRDSIKNSDNFRIVSEEKYRKLF